MGELISIIVPVYNVKEYLEDCIESLVNQTYKNLEIILVDDGSTDGSEDICDSYQESDNRILALHKPNGGLSDARNYGLGKARGTYIGFVDSDDYVSLEMFEILYQACVKYSTRIACARFDAVGGKPNMPIPKANGTVEILDGKEMLKTIMLQGVDNKRFATISVWDRLYERSVLNNLTFPIGKCYEDIVFSTKAILKAGKVTYIDEALYHYRIRNGSITHNNMGFNHIFFTDRIVLEKEQMDILIRHGFDDLAMILKCNIFRELYDICQVVPKEFRDEYNTYLKDYKPSFYDVKNLNYPFLAKMKLIAKVFLIRDRSE